MSEAENGDHEKIHASNNIPTRQKEFPIMENYIKTGGGYIKNTKIVTLNKRHFNEKINSKVYFNVFRVCKHQTFAPLHPTYSS